MHQKTAGCHNRIPDQEVGDGQWKIMDLLPQGIIAIPMEVPAIKVHKTDYYYYSGFLSNKSQSSIASLLYRNFILLMAALMQQYLALHLTELKSKSWFY